MMEFVNAAYKVIQISQYCLINMRKYFCTDQVQVKLIRLWSSTSIMLYSLFYFYQQWRLLVNICSAGSCVMYRGSIRLYIPWFTKELDVTLILLQWETQPKSVIESFVLLLSPFAPHLTEELWFRLGHPQSLAYEQFPEVTLNLSRFSISSLVAEWHTLMILLKMKI